MKEIVEFEMGGKKIKGRLVKDGVKTAIVKPYLWIEAGTIKIHKKKKGMVKTGETT